MRVWKLFSQAKYMKFSNSIIHSIRIRNLKNYLSISTENNYCGISVYLMPSKVPYIGIREQVICGHEMYSGK